MELVPYTASVVSVGAALLAALVWWSRRPASTPVPHFLDEPEPDLEPPYPPVVPPGQAPPPHDPWTALYASLARQRARWAAPASAAAGRVPGRGRHRAGDTRRRWPTT